VPLLFNIISVHIDPWKEFKNPTATKIGLLRFNPSRIAICTPHYYGISDRLDADSAAHPLGGVIHKTTTTNRVSDIRYVGGALSSEGSHTPLSYYSTQTSAKLLYSDLRHHPPSVVNWAGISRHFPEGTRQNLTQVSHMPVETQSGTLRIQTRNVTDSTNVLRQSC
jgi:hypothetical protein